ncbi:DMR6-like oxygenase 2-like protein [Tanacetum coccineum]
MPAALLAGESWDTRDFDQRDNGCVEACGVFDPIRFSSGFNAVEQNKDTLWREVLQLIAHPDFHCPHKPSRVLDIASEYVKRTQVIVNELLKGVSENFGFKSSYLNKELNFDSSFRLLAVNYCPFLPDFDLARGLMPHTDHGVLTLLYENRQGAKGDGMFNIGGFDSFIKRVIMAECALFDGVFAIMGPQNSVSYQYAACDGSFFPSQMKLSGAVVQGQCPIFTHKLEGHRHVRLCLQRCSRLILFEYSDFTRKSHIGEDAMAKANCLLYYI